MRAGERPVSPVWVMGDHLRELSTPPVVYAMVGDSVEAILLHPAAVKEHAARFHIGGCSFTPIARTRTCTLCGRWSCTVHHPRKLQLWPYRDGRGNGLPRQIRCTARLEAVRPRATLIRTSVRRVMQVPRIHGTHRPRHKDMPRQRIVRPGRACVGVEVHVPGEGWTAARIHVHSSRHCHRCTRTRRPGREVENSP